MEKSKKIKYIFKSLNFNCQDNRQPDTQVIRQKIAVQDANNNEFAITIKKSGLAK